MMVVNPLPLGKEQNKVIEEFIGRRRLAGKPKCRWKDAVWENAVYFLLIRKWKVAAWKEKVGTRRSGRQWPENGPRCPRRRR